MNKKLHLLVTGPQGSMKTNFVRESVSNVPPDRVLFFSPDTKEILKPDFGFQFHSKIEVLVFDGIATPPIVLDRLLCFAKCGITIMENRLSCFKIKPKIIVTCQSEVFIDDFPEFETEFDIIKLK